MMEFSCRFYYFFLRGDSVLDIGRNVYVVIYRSFFREIFFTVFL